MTIVKIGFSTRVMLNTSSTVGPLYHTVVTTQLKKSGFISWVKSNSVWLLKLASHKRKGQQKTPNNKHTKSFLKYLFNT